MGMENNYVKNKSQPERRQRVRFPVSCEITFFGSSSGRVLEFITQNISSTGFYFRSQVAFAVGDWFRCLLKMPSYEPSAGSQLTLDCLVRVVRIEAAEPGSFGVACRIEDYRSHAMD